MTVSAVDLLDAQSLRDPYSAYARLRRSDPVQWSERHQAWLFTGYESTAAGLKDPRLGPGRIQAIFASLPEPLHAELGFLRRLMSRWLVFLDAPEHTRLRALISYAFRPSYVAALRPEIEQLAFGLADRLASRQECDLIAEFAYPLPAMVIAGQLGIAPEQLDRVKVWSDSFASLEDGPDAFRFAQTCMEEMAEYIRPTIEARRRAPRDDLISHLVQAETDGELLSEDDLLATCVLLLFAGHETTTNLIGNGVRILSQHPEISPGETHAVSAIVDEILRFDGPVQRVRRVVAHPCTIGGHALAEGDAVWLLVGAANRDPAAFDEPDSFRPEREPGRHLTFGRGPHYCLGAALGQLEGEIGLRVLYSRFPRLRLAVTDEALCWRRDLSFRGLERLPVLAE